MQSEYDRIRAHSSEDPGTAGDEGESNWATLLRKWLPESYVVAQKGRLLTPTGERSRQLDVIVLRPGYPKRLLDKKLYLLDGVAAAFECKNTLKAEHVGTCFERGAELNRLAPGRGTIFAELVPPILYGLLAHSHVWQSSDGSNLRRVDQLVQGALANVSHMRDCPGLICVSDLACWSALRMAYDGPALVPKEAWEARKARMNLPDEGACEVSYMRYREDTPNVLHPPPNAISVAIAIIMHRLAHDDPAVRPLSQYFILAGLLGSAASVVTRAFSLNHFSDEVRAQLSVAPTINRGNRNWALSYMF